MKKSRAREPQGKYSKYNSVEYHKHFTLADILHKYRQENTTSAINMDLKMVNSEMFRQTTELRLTWMGPHSNLSYLSPSIPKYFRPTFSQQIIGVRF
jgi:sulfur carrier protein ThiS